VGLRPIVELQETRGGLVDGPRPVCPQNVHELVAAGKLGIALPKRLCEAGPINGQHGDRLGNGLFATTGGVVTICGSDFRVDGVPVPFGAIDATMGRLTGTLCDGSGFDMEFQRSFAGFRLDDSMGQIVLSSDAPVSSQEATWGSLKATFR